MHISNNTILNTIPHAAVLIDPGYIIRFANNSFHEIFKLDGEKITGAPISSVFNKNIYAVKIKPRIDECLKGKQIHDIIPITPGDASSDIMDVNYHPVYSDDNKVNGVMITSWKSKQKQTIQKKEISSGQLLQILNTVEDVVVLINLDFTIDSINNGGLSLLNKTLTEVLGKKCYDLICGNDGPPDFCPVLQNKNASLTDVTERYYEQFGKHFSLNASAVLDDQGNIVQYIDVMRDIDELKRSELAVREKNEEILTQNEEILLQKEQIQERNEEIVMQNEELQSNLEDLHEVTNKLKQNETRLSTAEEIAGMGSWEYNINTGTIWCSDGLYQLFDIPPANNTGINMDKLTSLVHPDDKEKVNKTLTDAIQSKTPYKIEHKIITSKNKTIDIISRGHVETDEIDHAMKLKGILLDITERKRATTRIIKNNKRLKALTHFRKYLLHTNNEQQLIENTCKVVADILEYPVVLISKKINNPSKDIRVIASRGIEQEYVKDIRGSWGDDEYGQGPGGLCIKTGKPRVNLVNDPSLAPWYDKAKHHQIRSLCAMPVYVHDEVIGTIAFYSYYEDTFNSDELDFLQNIANDLSFGIETIRGNNKRVEIQQALIENEQKLAAIFRGAPIIMMLLDSKGRVLKINDPALVYAEKTREEALNLKTGEVFGCINAIDNNIECGATRACQGCNIWNTVKKTFDTRENLYKVEARLTKNVNGVHDHYQLLISTALFSSSEPDTVLVSIDDITQRKKAENKLKESERKLREAQSIARSGNWEFDIIHDKLYWSEALFELFEVNPESFDNTYESFLKIIHPDDREMVNRVYGESLKDKKHYQVEHRILLTNGKIKHVLERCHTEYGHDNKPLLSVGIAMDITLIKQAHEETIKAKNAAEQSEEKFRQLAENIDQVFWLRTGTEMLYVSPAYEKIWGKSCQSLYDNPGSFLDSIHPDDKQKMISICNDHQNTQNSEYRIIRPDNTIRWIWSQSFPVITETGEIDRIAGIAEDITERKKAEKQIQHALQKEKELNDLRAQFVSTVTHEFRTPLAGIYSNTQLLDRYHERWDKTKKERSFKRIYSAINSMSSLLEDVLILGKEQSGRLKIKPEDTCLYDYIESLAEEANETNNDKQPIKIINSFPRENVRVDQTLLRHIMINVFTNALKYSSGDDPAPELTIRPGDKKETICFMLKDHGKGIPGHELKNIFQPFYRASNIGKDKGTGLGMSIVKRSIEIHGGTIDVQSEEGKGTTVTMQISFFI